MRAKLRTPSSQEIMKINIYNIDATRIKFGLGRFSQNCIVHSTYTEAVSMQVSNARWQNETIEHFAHNMRMSHCLHPYNPAHTSSTQYTYMQNTCHAPGQRPPMVTIAAIASRSRDICVQLSLTRVNGQISGQLHVQFIPKVDGFRVYVIKCPIFIANRYIYIFLTITY